MSCNRNWWRDPTTAPTTAEAAGSGELKVLRISSWEAVSSDLKNCWERERERELENWKQRSAALNKQVVKCSKSWLGGAELSSAQLGSVPILARSSGFIWAIEKLLSLLKVFPALSHITYTQQQIAFVAVKMRKSEGWYLRSIDLAFSELKSQ